MKSLLTLIVALPLALAGCQEREVEDRPTAEPVDPITSGKYSQTYEAEQEDPLAGSPRFGEPEDWQAERETGEEMEEQRATGEAAFDEQTGLETEQADDDLIGGSPTPTAEEPIADMDPEQARTEEQRKAANQHPDEPVGQAQDEQAAQDQEQQGQDQQAAQGQDEQAAQGQEPGAVELVYEEATVITPEGALDDDQPSTDETPPMEQGATSETARQAQTGEQPTGQQAQEQQANVEQLKQRISELENKVAQVDELQKQVQQLQQKLDQQQAGAGVDSQSLASLLEGLAQELRSGERFQAEREELGDKPKSDKLRKDEKDQFEHRKHDMQRRPTDDDSMLDESPDEPQLEDREMPQEPSIDEPHDIERGY